MRKFIHILAASIVLGLLIGAADAQPGGGKKDKGPKGGGGSESVDDFVKRMMEFNKAKDGKLTKTELTDTRLHGLFDRADTNKDGVVTREELEAFYAKENAAGGGKGGDKGDKGKGKGGDGKGPKGKGPPPDAGAAVVMHKPLAFSAYEIVPQALNGKRVYLPSATI